MGCGVRAAKPDLLRVVAVDGEAVADPAARRPGRGAYVHPSPNCLERARRRRAIPRALRANGPLADNGLASYLADVAMARGPGDRPRPDWLAGEAAGDRRQGGKYRAAQV
ncbi:MAG: YlxR family protein [Streptosporangiaceae bacterium]